MHDAIVLMSHQANLLREIRIGQSTIDMVGRMDYQGGPLIEGEALIAHQVDSQAEGEAVETSIQLARRLSRKNSADSIRSMELPGVDDIVKEAAPRVVE